MIKKLGFILVFAFLLSAFTPCLNGDTPNTYKVQISIIDFDGNEMDLSGVKIFAKSGSSIVWGKDMLKHYSANSTLNYETANTYIELNTAVCEDILFTLGKDNVNYAFFINEKVSKQELKKNTVIKKIYKLSNLNKTSLKTDFMNRSTGKYEVSIYNPLNTSLEADNYGSLFEMQADGTKTLFISKGKYNYAFKYLDKGICAFTYKDNVSAPDTKSIIITKSNVNLTKYTYKIPKILQQYPYFIMHVDRTEHRSYLNGMFGDNFILDFYLDKRVNGLNQKLILSKDVNDEYISSVWFTKQSKTPMNIGEFFCPGNIEVFDAGNSKKAIMINFDDLNGNSIRFIDTQGTKDTVIEVYDKKSGGKLYDATVSRYWDYFNPQLKNGSYIVKVYLAEIVQGMENCSYYDLTVNSSSSTPYKFTKLFSLKMQ